MSPLYLKNRTVVKEMVLGSMLNFARKALLVNNFLICRAIHCNVHAQSLVCSNCTIISVGAKMHRIEWCIRQRWNAGCWNHKWTIFLSRLLWGGNRRKSDNTWEWWKTSYCNRKMLISISFIWNSKGTTDNSFCY